jgi:hypothetical protein
MSPSTLLGISIALVVVAVACYLIVDIINKQMEPVRFKKRWNTHYPNLKAIEQAHKISRTREDTDLYEETGLLIEQITGKDNLTDLNVLLMRIVADKKTSACP